jgi:hypothetical protein
MTVSKLFRAAAGLLLTCAVPGNALAQSIRGAIGPQSSASVRISVSVLPRFDPSAGVAALRASPNTAALRFAFVPQAADSHAGPAQAGRRGSATETKGVRLVLVVPD